MYKNMIKFLMVSMLALGLTGCVTVYKNSTVMQYKGSAELQTDSLHINLNNKSFNVEESR